MIFWKDVLPNIDSYEILSDDMRDYFANTFFDPDDKFLKTLEINEPVVGKDFAVYRPEDESMTDAHEPSSQPPEIAKKTYTNNFFDTDSDPDENCLMIKVGEQAPIDDSGQVDDSLHKVFNAVLKIKPREGELEVMELEPGDILVCLADENVMSDAEGFKGWPSGVRKFAAQYEFFKDLFKPPNVVTGSARSAPSETSSLDTPEVSTIMGDPTAESTPLGDISNQPKSRVTRSGVKLYTSQTTPKGQPDKSDSAQKRATNLRMAVWGKAFIATKRRRESVSPETTPPK